jgi:hypothetical protein
MIPLTPMKIGTSVASLVFLSCFDVNESQKHHALLQVRMEVQPWHARRQGCEAISAATVERYSGDQMACSVRHMHIVCVQYSSEADRNGL